MNRRVIKPSLPLLLYYCHSPACELPFPFQEECHHFETDLDLEVTSVYFTQIQFLIHCSQCIAALVPELSKQEGNFPYFAPLISLPFLPSPWPPSPKLISPLCFPCTCCKLLAPHITCAFRTHLLAFAPIEDLLRSPNTLYPVCLKPGTRNASSA